MVQAYAPCHVCGELTSEHSNALCNSCGSPFHLALRNDIPAKDCGQVWINEELLALQFACNRCLSGEAREESIPPLLTQRRYARHEGTRAAAIVRGRRRRPRA